MSVNSLKAEIRYLFSGQGMPYEKVSIMVAMVVSLLLSVMLAGNLLRLNVLYLCDHRYDSTSAPDGGA